MAAASESQGTNVAAGVVVTRGVTLFAENRGSFIVGRDFLPALRQENSVSLRGRYLGTTEIGAGGPSLLAGDRNLRANAIGIEARAEVFQRLADECFRFGAKRLRVQCGFPVEGQVGPDNDKNGEQRDCHLVQ